VLQIEIYFGLLLDGTRVKLSAQYQISLPFKSEQESEQIIQIFAHFNNRLEPTEFVE
jgi:hypothetical protein